MGRKIVLYGTGFNGEKFYWGNLDRYEIAYCIDRNCNRTFHGLQVYSLEEKIDELNKCFVIIAAQHATYMQIAAKLIQSGLTAGTDFAWAQNIGKELMILYGNCHILALFDYLTKNIFLHKRYHFLLWRLDLSKTQPWPDSVFENCRVLICQDIRKENNLLVPAASEIENKVNNCIKIRLPNLFGFFAIFPQSISERYPQSQERDSFQNISQGGRLLHISDDGICLQNRSERELFFLNKNIRDLPSLRNVHIDEMYQKGAKLPEIVKSIQYEQIFYNIYDGFFDKIRKIRLREKECDIKIADFIVKNYKKHHLFYDSGHPTNKIIREFGKQICSILKIPYDEKITMSTFLDAGEVFIYGCVKKELGMTFVQDYIRCHNTNNTLYDAPLSLIEYVKEYLLWNFGKTL